MCLMNKSIVFCLTCHSIMCSQSKQAYRCIMARFFSLESPSILFDGAVQHESQLQQVILIIATGVE